MNKIINIIIVLLVAVPAIFLAYIFYPGRIDSVPNTDIPKTVPEANGPVQNGSTTTSAGETVPVASEIETKKILVQPLSSALERVTKKPFGIKVSPNNSPVNPERFSGYHTGVDFEIFSGEEDADVPVSAVCSGPLLEKRTVSGYGGVAIQKCSIENVEATVLYDHLKLSSIGGSAGDMLSAGDRIGILGKGYSAETSGERKHLHLGIRKGIKINYLGYVQSEGELSGWIDAMKYLK